MIYDIKKNRKKIDIKIVCYKDKLCAKGLTRHHECSMIYIKYIHNSSFSHFFRRKSHLSLNLINYRYTALPVLVNYKLKNHPKKEQTNSLRVLVMLVCEMLDPCCMLRDFPFAMLLGKFFDLKKKTFLHK